MRDESLKKFAEVAFQTMYENQILRLQYKKMLDMFLDFVSETKPQLTAKYLQELVELSNEVDSFLSSDKNPLKNLSAELLLDKLRSEFPGSSSSSHNN